MNWKYTQGNADKYLASGLKLLSAADSFPFHGGFIAEPGNYIIAHGRIKYIGEAKVLSRRLKQQSKEGTSTFYKNYVKKSAGGIQMKKGLSIEQFNVRTMTTWFGRKEIEEFGIVNLPAMLNVFQQGKRNIFKGEANPTLWTRVQEGAEELLKAGESEFNMVKCSKWFESDPKSKPGLYWVETYKHGLIYIGESSNIRERWEIGGAQAWAAYTAGLSLPVKVLQDDNAAQAKNTTFGYTWEARA